MHNYNEDFKVGIDLLGNNRNAEGYRASFGCGYGMWSDVWEYVAEHCGHILSEVDIELGDESNDHDISKDKAEAVGRLLLDRLAKLQPDEDGFYECEIESVEGFAEFCLRSGGFLIG